MNKKTYLVIGGTSGIGLEIVKKLSIQGHEVYAGSRTNRNLDVYDSVTHLEIDITKDPAEWDALPDQIDGIVYCPGTIHLQPFRRIKEEELIQDFQINVVGAVKVLQKAYSTLRKTPYGSVVLFSTVAVQKGMSFHTSVAAAKGAVEGITRTLAAEFAPNIRVNAIAPSLTDTPMAENLLSSDEKKERSANMHALKRVGKAEDQANAALFLLGEESGWMTGQILHVDGGLSVI